MHVTHIVHTKWGGGGKMSWSPPLYKSLIVLQSTDPSSKGTEIGGFRPYEGGLISWPPLVYM